MHHAVAAPSHRRRIHVPSKSSHRVHADHLCVFQRLHRHAAPRRPHDDAVPDPRKVRLLLPFLRLPRLVPVVAFENSARRPEGGSGIDDDRVRPHVRRRRSHRRSRHRSGLDGHDPLRDPLGPIGHVHQHVVRRAPACGTQGGDLHRHRALHSIHRV